MTDYGGSKTPKNERDYWQTPIEIFNALDREFVLAGCCSL